MSRRIEKGTMQLILKTSPTYLRIGEWYEGTVGGQDRLLRITRTDFAGTHAILADNQFNLLDFVSCRLVGGSNVELTIE